MLAKRPSWLIRQLDVLHVEIREDLPTFNIKGKNLSSNPEFVAEPMSLKAEPDEKAVEEWKAKLFGKKNGEKKDGQTEEKKGVLEGLIK